MTNRTAISLLIYGMVQGVLFGAGILAVVYIPALKAHATLSIPVVIAASIAAAIPLSWKIAPMMRARHQRRLARRRELAGA